MRTSSNTECRERSQIDPAQNDFGTCHSGSGRGKLAVVGIGPGNLEQMSLRAYRVIQEAQIVAGYKTYIDIIQELLKDKEVFSSGMKKEIERCAWAIEKAKEGKYVALVSSGDPGIYGMAGLILELLSKDDCASQVDVEIVPGISAANAAAASLGAPLMHDFAAISLSDLLTPWELIEKRLKAAAMADFVTVLYNPVSLKRTEQIQKAQKIFLEFKDPKTPVGLVLNAKRAGEEVRRTTLEEFTDYPMNMFTTVIIGNAATFHSADYMITPRGYKV